MSRLVAVLPAKAVRSACYVKPFVSSLPSSRHGQKLWFSLAAADGSRFVCAVGWCGDVLCLWLSEYVGAPVAPYAAGDFMDGVGMPVVCARDLAVWILHARQRDDWPLGDFLAWCMFAGVSIKPALSFDKAPRS